MTIYKEKKENIFTHEVTVFDYTGKRGIYGTLAQHNDEVYDA